MSINQNYLLCNNVHINIPSHPRLRAYCQLDDFVLREIYVLAAFPAYILHDMRSRQSCP